LEDIIKILSMGAGFIAKDIEYRTKDGSSISFNSMDLKGKERFPHPPSDASGTHCLTK
jgi:hypothetical protein